MEICDKYVVLRDGNMVSAGNVKDTSIAALSHDMVGHDVRMDALKQSTARGGEVLRLEDLTLEPSYRHINMQVYAGEVLGVTGLLGAKYYVHDLVETVTGVKMFLPTIIFLVAIFLAFSTGTSWGTFAILIPIVCDVFGGSPETYEMLVISIAACLAGAVCGDHCSPISDTTIMASAGAHSDHVNHVSTQLPYAITAAIISLAGFIMAGILGYTGGLSVAMIAMPVSLVLVVAVLLGVKKGSTQAE